MIQKNRLKVTEADITKQIRDYLELKRIFHWKVFQTLGSTPGVSDIIGIHKGKFLAIEVKTEKGILTENQLNFLANVKFNGGIALVARCLEDVIKNL